MNIKAMSFSSYKVNVDIYSFEKLSLFSFLFTKIITDESLDKDLLLVDCLKILDIKEDMLYLFNNVYYEFIDNKLIKEVKDDIYDLKIGEISLNKRFIKYLNGGYMPVFKESVVKEFIYDVVKNKVVVSDTIYSDSNIVVIESNNDFSYIENLINDNKESLFNLDNGECILNEVIINPYYFEINLKEKDDKYISDDNIATCINKNSLFINSVNLKGEILTNNIYFKYLYGKEELKDYSDYVFVSNKEKEFEVNNNIIYVNFNLDEGDFVDLVNKDVYKCGVYKVNDLECSTFYKSKSKNISEFKLYLTKNKDKFKTNIKEVINSI